MKDFDFLSLAQQIQTNTGVLVLFISILILATGGYFIVSDIELRRKFKIQCDEISKYKKIISKLEDHFKKSKTLSNEDFKKIIKEVLE